MLELAQLLFSTFHQTALAVSYGAKFEGECKKRLKGVNPAELTRDRSRNTYAANMLQIKSFVICLINLRFAGGAAIVI